MDRLIRGIHKFQADVFGAHQALFQRLAEGQQPETLLVTCSDSRIDPHLLTQTEPGELFVLRNAGNIVPPFASVQSGEAATIEYAISALGVRDIIVCGHTHCGAVQGLLALDTLDSMPSVRAWLSHAEPALRIVKEKYTDDSADELLKDAVKENVLVQLENLTTHPSVAEGLSAGRLKLYGWVYQFESGDVFAFDPEAGHFASVRK